MCTFLTSLAVLAAISLPVAAAEHYHHDHSPKHGGILAEAHVIDVELVAKADRLSLHVVADDQSLATTGARLRPRATPAAAKARSNCCRPAATPSHPKANSKPA